MDAPPTTTELPDGRLRSSRAGVALVAVLVVGVIAGGWWWWQQHAVESAAAFPVDPELRRARAMIFALDATVTDYAIAEGIVKEALVQRPDDPEALIVATEVNNWHFLRGFDRSEVRLWDMGAQARRALQLAPDRPEAVAAMGEYLLAREADLPRAAQLLREAIAHNNRVPRWHSSLAEVLRINDPAAGLAVLQNAVQRFPQDVLVRYNLARHYRDVGRLADMERELDTVIAMEPIANALLWKARVRLWAHGDHEGMKAALDRVPGPMRISERAAVNLFIHACVARQTEEALATLRALPSAWIEDYDFVGPKGLLAGHLLEMQGRRDDARLEYQEAYAEIARRRPSEGADSPVRVAELWTLIRLGRREEARASHAVYLSKMNRPYRLGFSTSWWFSDIPAAVELGDQAGALELLREAAETAEGRRQLRIALKIDPRMQALRNDTQVTAWLAEPGI